MDNLLSEIRNCTLCKDSLPNIPRPIVRASHLSKIVIIGQAPGQKVHKSGIPWEDVSGNNLRDWLGVDDQVFYDDKIFALLPMGFCFPGAGKSGDLPPRQECAPLWHHRVLNEMTHIKIVLLIGQYAQKFYLGKTCKPTLTETVKCYKEYLPKYLPLPHPSPRNNIWQRKNPWFEKIIIPLLQGIILEQLISES